MNRLKPWLMQLPFAYPLRIRQLRLNRRWRNLFQRFAKERSLHPLPILMKRHQSLLRRRLGSSDPQLQENKITNLAIAIRSIDGVIIRPGETFSFWKLIGAPHASKGYIEGLLLSQGEVKTGVGGGLCQLANLLFWMALHTPLRVVERHHHSFDPFPDDQRVLPFGSGASVFYNYIDLRFHNPTQQSFQIKLNLTEQHLKGAILTDMEWPVAYHIEERNHQFHRKDERSYRENEIWRISVDRRTGNRILEERMIHNYAEVKYDLSC